jgi:hypothetical protein
MTNFKPTDFKPLLQNAVHTNKSLINLPTFHLLQGGRCYRAQGRKSHSQQSLFRSQTKNKLETTSRFWEFQI